MKIVIFGASGRTGRLVVEQALALGDEVTAVVRRPSAFTLQHEALRVLEGDARSDAASVARAVAGQEAVVSAIGAARLGERSELVSEATRAIASASRASNVPRLVVLSVRGAGDSRAASGFLFDKIVRPALSVFAPGMHYTVYEDKERMEAELAATDLRWTAVRPCGLTDEPARGQYRSGTDLRGGAFARIARADVAAFMLAELRERRFERATPSLLPA